MEEAVSICFPFAIDDLVPSLYSSEFAYASCQRASLYSISQESVSHSLQITTDVLIQPTSVWIQPSSHPLLYYASHEKGLFLCDFRVSKPVLLTAIPHSSHLQRIENDWNCYCFAHDDEIDVMDVRNPSALEMRWRFDGSIQKLDCYRYSSSDYHILLFHRYLLHFHL